MLQTQQYLKLTVYNALQNRTCSTDPEPPLRKHLFVLLVRASLVFLHLASFRIQHISNRFCGNTRLIRQQSPLHMSIKEMVFNSIDEISNHTTFISHDGHLLSCFALFAFSILIFSSSSILLKSSAVTIPPYSSPPGL